MTIPAPRLDHVVVDARDRVDEAVRSYRALGFHVTERSRHTLGSVNHLCVFETDYLELLGYDETIESVRPDILAWPVGLNGLVFTLDQPEELYVEIQKRGVAVDPPQDFSRPVNLGGGKIRDAKFRVVRLRAGIAPFGRVYFCHHLTPELIWRPEWQRHANGARGIARILIAARDPAASVAVLRRIFGEDAVQESPAGQWSLAAQGVEVEIAARKIVAQQLGSAAPDPAAREDYMAALTVRTASLVETARSLEAGGVRGVQIDPGRVVVPASAAVNVAIEFVE